MKMCSMYPQTLGGSVERRARQFIHVTKQKTRTHLNIISTNCLLGSYDNYSLPFLNGFVLSMEYGMWDIVLNNNVSMQIIAAFQLHTTKHITHAHLKHAFIQQSRSKYSDPLSADLGVKTSEQVQGVQFDAV